MIVPDSVQDNENQIGFLVDCPHGQFIKKDMQRYLHNFQLSGHKINDTIFKRLHVKSKIMGNRPF